MGLQNEVQKIPGVVFVLDYKYPNTFENTVIYWQGSCPQLPISKIGSTCLTITDRGGGRGRQPNAFTLLKLCFSSNFYVDGMKAMPDFNTNSDLEPELRGYYDEVLSINQAAEGLLRGLSEAQLLWKPEPQ